MTTHISTSATVDASLVSAPTPVDCKKNLHDQAGFTLVEIAIVSGIIIIAAILGIPAFNGYIIEKKVPNLGQELQRFVARSKSGSQGSGPTPYMNVGAAQLANGLRGSSIVTILGSGADAVLRHGVGATDGVIIAAPDAITSRGDAFSLTLTKVNEAACPILAAVMQKVSERITINGQPVKSIGALGAQGAYDAQTAEAACTSGDSNTFVFVAR